jgi:hypothetical protein
MLKNFSLTIAIIKITGSTKTHFIWAAFFPFCSQHFQDTPFRWLNHLTTWKISPAFVENAGWSLKLWCLRESLRKFFKGRSLHARFANQFSPQNTLSRTPCCVSLYKATRETLCVFRYFLSRHCFHFNPLSLAKKIIGRNFQPSAGARIVRGQNFY